MKRCAEVQELLRRRIGLDPATAGRSQIERAMRDRMRALAIPEIDRSDYLRLLQSTEAEQQALVEEVVVPESWFFRDEAPFRLLSNLIESWKNEDERPPFRVLSLPCARGEEPYSIAMMFLDHGVSPGSVQIDAVDISKRSLDAARAGLYSENAFRARDLGFRARYFERTSDGDVLSPSVKALVTFHEGNILDPNLFVGSPPFDVVFCRNLLIYVDEPARRIAIENLDRLVGRTGTLFLGHAESVILTGSALRSTGDRSCFAFRRAGERPQARPMPKPTQVKPVRVARKESSKSRDAHPGPRAGVLETPPQPRNLEPSHPDAMESAAKLADQGRHDEARLLCEQDIRLNGPSARALFLLGVIRQATGDRTQAEACFQKTVYLEPRHEEALLSLALLAHRRGDVDAAKNYRRRAERAAAERRPS
jgi:chemotaxis protein methyltransferase WspC